MSTKQYPESTPPKPDKVAEPLATYYTVPRAQSYKPALPVQRIAGLEASDEVWQFAREQRLVPHLETSIRLARETLLDMRSLYLTFDPDPEIPSLHGIGIHAKMGTTDLDKWERQYRAFDQRFDQEVPNDFQIKICLFLEEA